MSNAFEDFRKWVNDAMTDERQKEYADQAREERRKLNAAIDIYESLRHGKITREQAIERINKELL